MKKIYMLILVLLSLTGADVWAHTDQEVQDLLRRSLRFNNWGDEKAARAYAFQMCNFDRDRFSRIAEDLTKSEIGHRYAYLGMIGDYGSTNSIPFLESYCTNAELGFAATLSILQLEGITTNSLRAVAAFQTVTNKDYKIWDDRSNLLGGVIRRAMEPGVMAENKAMALAYAFDVATNADLNIFYIERDCKCCDPTYLHSKRRLRILRAHATYHQTDFTMNYITNAINELGAYPEADLPD